MAAITIRRAEVSPMLPEIVPKNNLEVGINSDVFLKIIMGVAEVIFCKFSQLVNPPGNFVKGFSH